MNRINGIIVAVAGLLVTILSAVKILPHMMSTGSFLIFLGLLFVGLSFVPKPEAASDEGKMPLIETLTKIFYAPVEVFQNLRRHPRWLAALLISASLAAVYSNAFFYRLTPERITNYTIDKVLESPMMASNEQARKSINDSRQQSLEDSKHPLARVSQAINSFIGLVFLTAFLALIIWGFAMAMGGQMNYWQAFSATAYAALPVNVLNYLLSLVILFVKDPDEIHPILAQNSLVADNLGALVTPGDNPVLFVVLSSIGLLAFYRLWMLATGVKNAGERVTSTIAWSAVGTVWVLGLLLGVISAFAFGSFFS